MRRLFAVLPALALAAAAWAPLADEPKKDDPAPLKLSDDEKALLDLVNAERDKEKLPPLAANPVLFRVARAHSANMAKKGEMKHDLDGKNPKDRVDAAGYDYRRIGENIAEGENAAPEDLVKGWMNSKAHRENILNPSYTETGLGVATNDKGETYYTQLFAEPKKK
jgi:uncharacterized protein YkwD